MNTKSFATLAVLTCSTLALGAPKENDASARQLQIYPKNLARQHVGTNLFIFNPTNQTYTNTEAAAAWLDDDITTGWPIMAGKQHYLLTFSEPQLLSNFSISARAAEGTISLYAADEPATPSAKAWASVAKDVPLAEINQKKLERPFSRFAKYLLIETDIADPGPLFSLYVYGQKPAVSYTLEKRAQAIDTRSVFGPYVNPTAFSVSALYSGSRVAHANAGEGFLAWQKAVDENPESGVAIAPSTDQSGAVIEFGTRRSLSRVALLTDGGGRGRLDLFVSDAAEAAIEEGASVDAASLAGLRPTVSIALDGQTTRNSLDFPATEGSRLLVRWTPESGTDPITIRELNAFAEVSLAEYELSAGPDAVAEYADAGSGDSKSFNDFKGAPEEIREFLPGKSPYLPGALGFPPNITGRVITGNPLSPE